MMLIESPAITCDGLSNLRTLAGCGFVPFEVTNASISFRAGQTAVLVNLETQLPVPQDIGIEIVIEDYRPIHRHRGLSLWRDFLRALGFRASVDDTDEILGRWASVRVDQDGDVMFATLSPHLRAA